MLVGTSLVTRSPSGSAPGSLAGGASIRSSAPSSTMPEGVVTRPPALAVNKSGSAACISISFLRGPPMKSRVDVAVAVAIVRTLALLACELTLEKLAPAADGAERVAVDDEQRRVERHNVAAARADFVDVRLVDPRLGSAGGLGVIN